MFVFTQKPIRKQHSFHGMLEKLVNTRYSLRLQSWEYFYNWENDNSITRDWKIQITNGVECIISKRNATSDFALFLLLRILAFSYAFSSLIPHRRRDLYCDYWHFQIRYIARQMCYHKRFFQHRTFGNSFSEILHWIHQFTLVSKNIAKLNAFG